MDNELQTPDRFEMGQRERDTLKVLQAVRDGQRTQVEAARLLKRSVRHVRRLLDKLERDGDQALVHGLRGQPSNHRHTSAFRRQVLKAYRQRYRDFGPTLAAEKLAAEELVVGIETLRRWLLEEGLWERRRQRDPHRTRRPRRLCFGELIQMDASIHDWLEARGETLVLIAMIDDATNRIMAQFYPHSTVEAHMDLLGQWLRQHGRPVALYTDRHSIFQPQDKGRAVSEGTTQFGRALAELDIALIRAHSPQAKGRVERLFGTLQDRWVKELRLADVRTCAEANALIPALLADYHQRFTKAAAHPKDAHRSVGHLRLDAILSIQSERVVSNDYTIRFANQYYQLLKPVYAGERGGRVLLEERLDGSLHIRFGKHYLNYKLLAAEVAGGSTPTPPEFNATPTSANRKDHEPEGEPSGPTGTSSPTRRSGRTPAEPYPSAGEDANKPKGPRRPAENHPWRKGFKKS